MSKTQWTFVIDTDSYSGNFERELTGYMTGTLTEDRGYGHGAEESELFLKECGTEKVAEFDEMIDPRPVDHGDSASVDHYAIWDTPGWFNNGVGGHFEEGQEQQALDHYKAYYTKEANNKSLHPLDRPAHQQRCKDAVAKANLKTFKKYPCYQSVALFLNKKPTEAQMQFWFERAKKFAQLPKEIAGYELPKITGCRLIKGVRKTQEVWSAAV